MRVAAENEMVLLQEMALAATSEEVPEDTLEHIQRMLGTF